MGAAWRAKCLIVLLLVLNAGCGAADTAPTEASNEASVELPSEPATLLLDAAGVPVNRSRPTPTRTAVPASTPSAVPTVVATANPDSAGAPTTAATAVDEAPLLEAAQNSPFHQFGDDVYTWDDDRGVVILKVPVGHPALDEVRNALWLRDGNIEDTPETRLWVQQCARRHSDQALSAPDAVYGAVSAQSVYSCLGGLARLVELFARYWWAEAGVACLADAVAAYSLEGDAQPHPLAVCPSVGYNPIAPRPSGWLAQRCAEIVAASPNPEYPTDPAQSGDPLPSCWAPIIEGIEAHAVESAEIGLPDSPHDCYHAFLGYVWARQTGRESRPPSDLAIDCRYRAFEAIP